MKKMKLFLVSSLFLGSFSALSKVQDITDQEHTDLLRKTSQRLFRAATSMSKIRNANRHCDVTEMDIMSTFKNSTYMHPDYPHFQTNTAIEKQLGKNITYKLVKNNTYWKAEVLQAQDILSNTIFYSPARGAYGSTTELLLNEDGTLEMKFLDIDLAGSTDEEGNPVDPWIVTTGTWKVKDGKVAKNPNRTDAKKIHSNFILIEVKSKITRLNVKKGGKVGQTITVLYRVKEKWQNGNRTFFLSKDDIAPELQKNHQVEFLNYRDGDCEA